MDIKTEIKKAIELEKKGFDNLAKNKFLELLELYPDNDIILSFLGLFYYNHNQYRKAEELLEKSYKYSNQNNLMFYIANTKKYLNKNKEAIDYYTKILEFDRSLNIYLPLIEIFMQLENYIMAHKYSTEAINIDPLNEKLLEYIAYSSLKIGEFKQSIKYAEILIKKYPKNVQGWFTSGLIFETLYKDYSKAVECYKNIVKYGNKAKAYLHIAICYGLCDETKEIGFYYLKKAKTIDKSLKGLNQAFANYYLSKKQFKKGYKYFINSFFENIDRKLLYTPKKKYWEDSGKHLKDTLLIYGDQGLGDQIQYARYLSIVAKYFSQVKVLASEKLYTILKESYKHIDNIKIYKLNGAIKKYPKYDQFTLMSWLPYNLNMNFDNIPYSNGYLTPSKKYSNNYDILSNEKVNIGICWQAGAANLREQIHRTINIEQFEKIINLTNANIYSFQVNPVLQNYKKYSNIKDLGCSFHDFNDTANAMQKMDYIVTVDTSVAHIAGALGIKTILILPFCADWRWFNNTEKTEWYDSVKIFKQKDKNSWNDVFDNVLEYLEEHNCK